MNKFVLMLSFILPLVSSFGQDSISTLLLNKETLSGIGLKKTSPQWADPERKLFSKSVFSGENIGVNVTSSSTAYQDWKNYAIDEFVYILNGQAILKLQDGTEMTFNKGDFFVVPKGFTGRWTTNGSQGNFLEIAVYSKKRSQQALPNLLEPMLVDELSIAGIKEPNEKPTFYGSELVVTIAERALNSTEKIQKNSRDKLCYILNGLIEITDTNDTTSTYYAGDFYLIPKGFEGKIVCKGFDSFRELIVETSENL